MKKSQYFYNKQLRRYLLQVIRIFSGFSVNMGKDSSGSTKYRAVPCTYADMTRLGATYLSDNTENILQSAPMMAIHIADIQPLSEYRHTPHYEGVSRFTKKQKNEEGKYINKPGKKYTVEQFMPVPFTMDINLDIWTTSTDQKFELFEQLSVWFNPGFEFMVTDSPFDMGRYANIEMQNIQWTSRSVPQSSAVEIDVMTITFRIYPVFITSPAKIKRQTLIHSVHTNIHTTNEILSNKLDDIFQQENVETSNIVVTPSDYDLEVFKDNSDYYARLVNESGYGSWPKLFDIYGEVVENETYLKIRQSDDSDDDTNDIYATYEVLEDDDSVIRLNFDVDTFRAPTLEPVDKIINPNKGVPSGSQEGSRYLLGKDIEIDDWEVGAKTWDIIQLIDGEWEIVFDASEANSFEYVINLAKHDLYMYDPEMGAWISAVEGIYQQGFWLFDIQKVVGC